RRRLGAGRPGPKNARQNQGEDQRSQARHASMIAPEFGYESLNLGYLFVTQGAPPPLPHSGTAPTAGTVIHHSLSLRAKRSNLVPIALPTEIASSLCFSQ